MLVKNPMHRKILSVLSYLVIAGIISFFVIGRYSPSLKVGGLAPIDDKIQLLQGSNVTFKSLLARKVTVINFWATWCPPCQKELPIFSKLASTYSSRVNFIGAIVDSPKEDVLALKNRFSLSYPLGFVEPQTVNRWQAEVLPTTYVLDPFGSVVWAKSGALSEEALESALQRAIKQQ